MNVASLDLCKELYELSGWDDTEYVWAQNFFLDGKPRIKWDVQTNVQSLGYKPGANLIPAYDLGYLLRKLPKGVKLFRLTDEIADELVPKDSRAAHWRIIYELDKHWWLSADTPEDATCKLAIELIKQGILIKENKAV